MSHLHPSLRTKAPPATGPDTFWSLNPGLRQHLKSRNRFKFDLHAAPGNLVLFLATLSSVSLAAVPATNAPATPAAAAPVPVPTGYQPQPAAADPLPAQPLASQPLPPFAEPPAPISSPLPATEPEAIMEGGAANLATPVGSQAAASPLDSIESFGYFAQPAETTLLGAAQVPAEAAPASNAASQILGPVVPPSPKRWSGSAFMGYSYMDNPRINDGAGSLDDEGGGDSILQTGLNLSYLFIGDTRRQLAFTGGYNYDFYADNSDLNGDTANATLSGTYGWDRTSLSLFASWGRSNGANRIVDDEISSDSIGVGLTLSYELTGKTSVFAGVNTSYDSFDNYLGSDSYAIMVGANYAFSPKTVFGVNFGTGITNQDQSQTQNFGNVNLTVAWNASAKLSLNGSVGYEIRKSDSEDFQGDGPGPIFNFNAAWLATPKSSFSFGGSRNATPSPLAVNSNIDSTRLFLGGSWAMTQRVKFSTNFGYNWDDYAGATGNALDPSRTDQYWSLNSNLSISLSGPWALNFFHIYNAEATSQQNSGFGGNRFGVNLSYNF